MSNSKFEKTQGTVFSISDAEVASIDQAGINWLSASCSTKELSFTGGQKDDIDVTTLCSEEKEMTNGLAAPSEMTINRNWTVYEEAQRSLMAAYNTDTTRAVRVVFPSGNGYMYIAEVRQNSWIAGVGGVVSASYTLRIKGKPVDIFAVNIPVTGVALDKTTASLTLGNSLTLTPTIAPPTATNRNLTWSSSDSTRVMVNSAGKITGLSVGTATITVKTSDGAKTATCAVTVTA
ncbi:Kappa-carrageenase precursor [Serratia fonticola]|nr:Kappa-carrageenase precursor [Serratia fonticola]